VRKSGQKTVRTFLIYSKVAAELFTSILSNKSELEEGDDCMKKFIALLLVLVCVLGLVGCSSKLVEGSEKAYSGTVTDRAMSVVNEGDRQGRSYIIISTGDEEICFWLTKDCETNAKIGDEVIIESAIEEQTDLLIATSITVE
jgi:hypothetical protein